MQKLENPLPLFLDGRGALLDAGRIYVGAANQDPRSSPVTAYLNKALSVPIAQPLRTLGGRIVSGQNAVAVFLADGDYSLRIEDADELLVASIPSVSAISASSGGGGGTYQPLDPDLTAIAALATTSFGRGLLTLANQAALKAATGIQDALPLIGGTVTGPIVRGGAGAHVYHASAAMTSGRIFVTPSGAGDPTSQPGDIWLTY